MSLEPELRMQCYGCNECNCLNYNVTKNIIECRSINYFLCISEVLFKYYPKLNVDTCLNILKDNLKEISKKRFQKTPTEGSLNNSGGRWYELLFLHQALDFLRKYNTENNSDYSIFKLPSATGNRKFNDIFESESNSKIKSTGIFSSNPDFIITNKNYSKIMEIPDKSEGQRLVDNFRDESYFNTVHIYNLIMVLSVKTSTRPDRRYQHMYEANVHHVITSLFNKEIPYVVYVTEIKDQDIKLFNTPSIISIIKNKKQPAVTSIIKIDKFEKISQSLGKLINDI